MNDICPNRAYRYLDAEWGPRFWNDALIGISTTKSVAQIEGRQRDPGDSAVVHTLQHHFKGRVEDEPAALAAAARVGIHMENCFDMRIEDARHVSQISGYMFCMCLSPDSRAFPGKDWVFEITDIAAFADELGHAAEGRLPTRWAIGPVQYQPRQFNALLSAEAEAHPFIKAAGLGYEDEEEARIFWPTEGPRDRISVQSRGALRHVRLIRSP